MDPTAERDYNAAVAALAARAKEISASMLAVGRALGVTCQQAAEAFEVLARLLSPLDPALLDLARSEREADFRWLAAANGVPTDAIDALWKWARKWARPDNVPRSGRGRVARRAS